MPGPDDGPGSAAGIDDDGLAIGRPSAGKRRSAHVGAVGLPDKGLILPVPTSVGLKVLDEVRMGDFGKLALTLSG